MKSVVININMEIEAPGARTDEEAIEFAENYELPKEYIGESFEVVKVIDT